jgi:hypothetical protein
MEISRTRARQTVLGSISEVPLHALSRLNEALSGVQDEITVIGRATKYLSVSRI